MTLKTSEGRGVDTCQDAAEMFESKITSRYRRRLRRYDITLAVSGLGVLALEQLLRIPIYTHVILKSTENNSIVKNTKISQANY